MTLIAGHEEIGTRCLGAFQESVVTFVLAFRKCHGWTRNHRGTTDQPQKRTYLTGIELEPRIPQHSLVFI